MNKTAMWVIGGVVAVALAAFLLISMKSSSPSNVASPQAQTGESSSGSLAALVAKGGTVTCQVNHSSGEETTKGTVYVANGKVRGDFESTVPKVGPVQSHMISDGQYVYVWSSMMPSGMKMKAAAPNQNDTTGKTSSSANLYGQNYDYNCTPWGADQSKFELPSGITFNDMSAMMQAPAGASAAGAGSVKAPAPNCAMCDQAPASARAQCKAALGCK